MPITPYERTKAWRLANHGKHATQQRRYYLAHKEKIADYQRSYNKKRRNEGVKYPDDFGNSPE